MPPKKNRKSVAQKRAAAQRRQQQQQAHMLKDDNASSGKDESEDVSPGSEDTQLALAKKLGGMDLNMKKLESDAHEFWDSQPVSKISDRFAEGDEQGPLDPPKTVDDVRKEPYVLSELFEWTEVDMNDEDQKQETYDLLNSHYVEDDDNMFRFDYSKEFLAWAVQPPGWRPDWIIGVRTTSNKKLVAFISAIPADIVVFGRKIKMVEINFLCVHQKLRDKRLAPILIKEITRRVNLTDIWQASFTAGKVLPRPISRAQYHHRNLNPKKLIDVKFSHLGPNMTMARTIKLFKLPSEPQLPGIRAMKQEDVPSACALLNKYLEQFFIKAHFSEAEFAHWFMPRTGVVMSYVIADPTGVVTDFVSFYSLPSSILNNPKYSTLNAAYSYYNVANTVPLKDLVNDALIFAQLQGFDVFNCLEVMHNAEFLTPLKFGKGDGYLQYYLYNWKCPDMPSSKVGLVLL